MPLCYQMPSIFCQILTEREHQSSRNAVLTLVFQSAERKLTNGVNSKVNCTLIYKYVYMYIFIKILNKILHQEECSLVIKVSFPMAKFRGQHGKKCWTEYKNLTKNLISTSVIIHVTLCYKFLGILFVHFSYWRLKALDTMKKTYSSKKFNSGDREILELIGNLPCMQSNQDQSQDYLLSLYPFQKWGLSRTRSKPFVLLGVVSNKRKQIIQISTKS